MFKSKLTLHLVVHSHWLGNFESKPFSSLQLVGFFSVSCQSVCTKCFLASVNLELSMNDLPIATHAS